jgi:hypothetical protein
MERIKALKQVYDLALGTGRSWQNSQTGWIQYCYNIEDENEHYTIPVYENFLYVLALMKSKVGDNIQEAKGLLEKLLAFQTDSFSVYLHEYPIVRDRWLSIHLLPVYALILDGFGHVIGETLLKSLKQSLKSLVDYTFFQMETQPPPYHLVIKLGGALVRLGKISKIESWQDIGERLLVDAFAVEDRRAWFSPPLMGEMLVGLQLAYPSISESIWGSLWKTVCESWSIKVGAFAGPSWKEYHYGQETQTTLYDLFMSVYSGAFPYRTFADHPVQLQGVLISETDELFPAQQEELWQDHWFLRNSSKYSIGVMSKTAAVSESWEKGYIPFKVLWGDLNRYRSLVLQGGNFRTLSYELKDRGIDLIIELDEPIEKDDREKHREICFFTENYVGDKLLVSDSQATTFKLNEPVTLHSNDRHFQLIFQQIQGSGEFMGHIMKGNRPSQIGVKGKHRTEAFDWMIFLRSVRRTGVCRFLVSFSG